MKIGVLMDPLIKLNPTKDTTLALIKSAMKLGHAVQVFYPEDWFWQKGEVFALTSSLKCHSVGEVWERGSIVEQPLTIFDIILMRQDPPVNQQYLYATYALEHAQKAGVLISNHPQAVRDSNEKFAITHYPKLITPTLITQSRQRLRAFWEQHHDVVYKPIDAYGGESVLRVDANGSNLTVILDLLTQHGTKTIMAQRYIPEIKSKGDKRILMIHGKPVPYALARMPAKNDWRGNLAAGATGEVVPLTERDKEICAGVSPFLKARGLHLVGLDVIGDWLTEINVTSPTCLVEIEKGTGLDLAGQYWEGLTNLPSHDR